MTIRYRADYAGTRALMNSPEMQEMLRSVAEQGMASAVAAAPVYQGRPRRGVTPGEYKAAFRVEVHANGGVHNDRAEALIINDSGHSVLVEWVDDYHTLRDAAEELRAL